MDSEGGNMGLHEFRQRLVVSLVKLSFKPLQGLRVNPYRVFGVVGAEPLHGAEPHIKKGCEV